MCSLIASPSHGPPPPPSHTSSQPAPKHGRQRSIPAATPLTFPATSICLSTPMEGDVGVDKQECSEIRSLYQSHPISPLGGGAEEKGSAIMTPRSLREERDAGKDGTEQKRKKTVTRVGWRRPTPQSAFFRSIFEAAGPDRTNQPPNEAYGRQPALSWEKGDRQFRSESKAIHADEEQGGNKTRTSTNVEKP